ncbi:MAG: hypothetical protein ACLP1D_01070, partial [Xanthobacteraceae bacterium]
RTADLDHSSDGPSWIDLAEIRVNTTESRFAAGLNRLLQQNLPTADSIGLAPLRRNFKRRCEIGHCGQVRIIVFRAHVADSG